MRAIRDVLASPNFYRPWQGSSGSSPWFALQMQLLTELLLYQNRGSGHDLLIGHFLL